ncbi:MAG: UDP-glucose 4-epimerase GalE [Acetobacteraceae bacterium]|nr:UDP-glucose 4-epimerase GalE [Acetobacteraceae bacterium]MBV8521122.1 UDP-glucose 4-epimerase GalE [Acetobacteraceae bacterium]
MDRRAYVKRILVTGGAGYIGSHTCKCLASAGIEPVTYDNLVSGHREAVKWGPLIIGDVLDRANLERTLRHYRPDGVMHFAAHAYVGESVQDPGKYYANNVCGTLSLLDAMRAADVLTLVFSSTCATYGVPDSFPVTEEEKQAPVSPYGRSKLMIEHILADYAAAYGMRYAALRYFNACGADVSGEIGENHDPETHLIPRTLMAAAGRIPYVEVFGTDYDTPDGTCVRDYIHVTDLADAHLAALHYLHSAGGNLRVNLGTGRGISVEEVLERVERVTGRAVPRVVRPRRAGDPPFLYADASKAKQLLGFRPRFSDLDTIIATAWRYMRNNHSGEGSARG